MDYWTKYGEDLRSNPEAQKAQRTLMEAWDDRKWREERSLPEGCEPLESGAGCPMASGWKHVQLVHSRSGFHLRKDNA